MRSMQRPWFVRARRLSPVQNLMISTSHEVRLHSPLLLLETVVAGPDLELGAVGRVWYQYAQVWSQSSGSYSLIPASRQRLGLAATRTLPSPRLTCHFCALEPLQS